MQQNGQHCAGVGAQNHSEIHLLLHCNTETIISTGGVPKILMKPRSPSEHSPGLRFFERSALPGKVQPGKLRGPIGGKWSWHGRMASDCDSSDSFLSAPPLLTLAAHCDMDAVF